MPLVLLPLVLAHRYQLCNFSCTDGENWLACRSEKCTPHLPEDFCKDGSEPTLNSTDGTPAIDQAGVKVTGPQQCAEIYEMPLAGSFAERCDLCQNVAAELATLWYEAGVNGTQQDLSPGDACDQADARARAMLPTVRTCRYHPPACEAVLAATREHACPQLWEMRRGSGDGVGRSAWWNLMFYSSEEHAVQRAVREAQRELCGALSRQRNESGVEDALVCPHPRDVGARIMVISVVIACAIFAAQLAIPAGIGLGRSSFG